MDIAINPTIRVLHKAKASQAGLRIMLALAPIWAFWAPCAAVWLSMVIVQGEYYSDVSLISLLAILLAVFAVATTCLLVCIRNEFLITPDRITFPVSCLFEMRFLLGRKWSEIDAVYFVDSKLGESNRVPSERPDTMKLVFSDGACLPLELSAFKNGDLQNLILAFQSYMPQLPMYPPLSEVKLGISAQNAAQSALTFTQIWEEDMSSRFGSTVFIPLEPGSNLQEGRLKIVGQIAFGGLSAIYLARAGEEKLCIVKEAVLPANADKDSREKALQMFQRESQILMSLKHPRIASVLDYFIEQGRHYMLLEYIDGKDLRKFVKEKGPQSEAVVLRWAVEIAEVLDYLHKLDPPIVHRDLTPDNLVLEANGSIAVIDFGAANEFIGTATGTLVGKQSYISPDQFRGKATPQSDLYSFGATLYFLLTGKDPEALSVSRVRGLVPACSEETECLIVDLTALDARDRIQSAADVLEKCRGIIAAGKTKRCEGAELS